MTLEAEIGAVLGARDELAALVADRIFPAMAPEGTALPYIVFSRAAGRNLGTLGARGAHDLMQVDFECVAEETRPMEALAVARELRLALDSYSSDGVLQAAGLVNQVQTWVHEPRQLAVVLLSFSILAAE